MALVNETKEATFGSASKFGKVQIEPEILNILPQAPEDASQQVGNYTSRRVQDYDDGNSDEEDCDS